MSAGDGRLVSMKAEKLSTLPREDLDATRGHRPLADEEVALLIDALKAGDYKVRLQAAQALGEGGPDAAVDPLVKSLKDPNNEVRDTAVAAIGKIVKRRGTP